MRSVVVILSIACWLFSTHTAEADKRVAFVAGNGAYQYGPKLPNPPIDARSMAVLLRSIGFDVVLGINLSHDAMTKQLLAFGKMAQGADVALFYYAGYGVAIDKSNYLLPVDADIRSERDLKLHAGINVELAVEQTMSDAKVRLIFLEACRDNPFAEKIRTTLTRSASVSAGLTEMQSGQETLIAFATGPGQVALDGTDGANSPFTAALLNNIAKPGVEIQQAITAVRAQVVEQTSRSQVPWGNNSLTGSVVLNPKAPESNDVEAQFWKVVKDSDQPAALRAYLSSYPNGQFKSQALARIAALERKSANSSKPTTPAAGVDDAQKQPPPVSPALPEIPWPPPNPSSYYVLPDELLQAQPTVGDATKAIISALESTGYVERTFFRTSQGGVALVTRLERFMPDGSPGRPERWSINDEAYHSAANITKFLHGLFFVEEGHYRLIVFVVQKDIFIPSSREMDEPEARNLIKRGANALPEETRKQTFDGNHCTVLVYEFSSDGKTVRFVEQSSLPAKEHLAKAGVLAGLGKGK